MKPLDVIVVGGGIAGMAYAAALIDSARNRPLRIRVLSKAPVAGSSSHAAQGGVAAAMGANDSFELHAADTVMVGAGRNDPDMVELVVREGPSVIHWLERMGAVFDKDATGRLEMAREGGHSVARVVHHRDRTGGEIVRALRMHLRNAREVELIEGQHVLDLVVEDSPLGRACTGVRAIEYASGDLLECRSDLVILATGGAGQVYEHTTNPIEATGDGIAMALRAGVALRDMAFVQFHPTALYTGERGQTPLISEAVRGAGARLLRHDGRHLMSGLHPAGDLAPRNVVARAILTEMRSTGVPYALLDASPIGSTYFAQLFPAIERECRSHGLAPGHDLLPVMPAAHYLCGGIAIDDRGRTSLSGLMALGECAGSGLHGADRLASNSLLEALVLPQRAALASWAFAPKNAAPRLPGVVRSKLSRQKPATALRAQAAIRHAMSTHLGLLRNRDGMEAALRVVAHCERVIAPMWMRRRWSLELINLRDLSAVARAIIEGALNETTSIGTHHLEARQTVAA